MDIKDVLELKRMIRSGNEAGARELVKVMAESYLNQEYPDLKEVDYLLYSEVLHRAIPMMMDVAKKQVYGDGRLAS